MSGTFGALWAASPRVSRLVVACYPVVSLALMLGAGALPALNLLFPPCSVYTVLYKGLLWAVPLSFLYRPLQFGPAVIFLFVELYVALTLLPPRERARGSGALAAWLLVTTGLTNIVFLVAAYLMSLAFGQQYLLMPIQGLWPLVMICITLRSMEKPDEATSFYGVVSCPNRWYPVFLAAGLSLLNGNLMWDLLAALAVGYGHELLRVERLADGLCTCAGRLCGCCGRAAAKVGGCVGGAWIPPGGAPARAGDVESGSSFLHSRGVGGGPVQRAQPAAPSFRMFQGSGQRLGG